MQSISNLNSDFGYYNFLLTNNTELPVDASFNEERNQPILQRIEDFQVGVVRFRIPLTSVPLMQFKDNEYAIGFTIGVGQTDLLYQKVIYDPTLVSNDLYDINNRFIYHYDQILEMMNATLLTLWTTALVTPAYQAILPVPPTFDIANPPKFKLDDTSSYLILELPYGINTGDPVQIFSSIKPEANMINIHLSPKLDILLSGFPTYKSTTPPVGNPPPLPPLPAPQIPNPQLLFRMNLNQKPPNLIKVEAIYNSTGAVETEGQWYMPMYQDYSNLYLFQDLARILLVTNIPIENEQIGASNTEGQPVNLSVLTDFEVPADKAGNLRDFAFYQPAFVRYANFNSNGALRKLQLKIYYQNNDLDLFPIRLLPGEQATVKIQFKRRKAMNLLQYSARDNNRYA